MWDLPRPGLKPVCPALASGFLTTAPPGKSLPCHFLIAFPLFLHCLTFLISNCFSLPFGTLESCTRLKLKGFCSRKGPTGSCLVSFLCGTISVQHPMSGTHSVNNSMHENTTPSMITHSGARGTTPTPVPWQISQGPRLGDWDITITLKSLKIWTP